MNMTLGQPSKFGTYYDQRKSLFELLPDTKNEIIFPGNSITDGSEWGELLQNPRAKNRGISGDTSEGEAAETQVWLKFANTFKYLNSEDYVKINSDYNRIIAQIVTMALNPEKWSF